MADLTPGQVFADGDEVTAAKLNSLVDEAVLTAGAVLDKAKVTSMTAADQATHFMLLGREGSTDTEPQRASILVLVPVDGSTIERDANGKLRVAANLAVTTLFAGAVQAAGATPSLQVVDTDGPLATHHYAQFTLACGAGVDNQWLYLQGIPRGGGDPTRNPVLINIRAPDNSLVLNYDGSLVAASSLSAASLYSSGNVQATNALIGGALRVTQQPAPAPTDSGTPGDVRFTSSHIYYCVSSGDWRRAALSTWTP